MAIRKLIQLGHPALKAKNKSIKDFNSPKLKKLIQDLKDTMEKAQLIGIAAPQIGKNYKIFLTHARSTTFRKFGKSDELRIYINPKITKSLKEKIIIYEGCGSVGSDIFGPVIRPKVIEIEAFDEKEKKFRLKCDGILARVILHEQDHLKGIEFTEKVDDYKKLLSREFYIKSVKYSKTIQKASMITTLEYKNLT